MDEYSIDVIREKYSLVPRTLIFIRREDHYLLIHKKKKDSYGFGKLNGVGGHMEKGEEPFLSARREIREETGLKIGRLNLAAILFIDIGEIPGIQVFVFSAEYSGGDVLRSDEGELIWMSLNEIKSSQEILNDVPMLIKICGQHIPGSAPVIITYAYDKNGELRIDIVRD